MNPTSRPTIRSIARALHLSHTTVSEALRDQPRVNPATRAQVQAFAREAGYRCNPFASSILSQVRRTSLSTFHGVLAAVGLEEPARVLFPGAYWRDLQRGATERAGALGFKLERFTVGQRGLSMSRLDTILQSRGIRGVLILPAWNRPDFTQLSWKNYTGVYADYLIDQPGLHSVCPDHPRAMALVMHRLHELGFRRPGLVLLRQESTRIHHRWLAAFLAQTHLERDFARLPPLLLPAITPEEFKRWFRKSRPDVVIGHRSELVDWMRACGARVPETHGFCCLNTGMNTQRCAGLNQRPYFVGARAVEQVIAQIHHNDFGIPALPCNSAVPAEWIDGPTLRAR